MKIETKEVDAHLWPEVERLFGKNGACGGCWCQAWRIEKGESWDEVKGPAARGRLRRGIAQGTMRGILAFVDGEAVGWCTFGPRDTFPRLNRAASLKCGDSAHVWSVPCFFVSRSYRGKGVAAALLRHALKVMKQLHVEIVEGYPVKPDKRGRYIAAFSWTGTRQLFANAGFAVVGNRNGAKQRVRKMIRHWSLPK